MPRPEGEAGPSEPLPDSDETDRFLNEINHFRGPVP